MNEIWSFVGHGFECGERVTGVKMMISLSVKGNREFGA